MEKTITQEKEAKYLCYNIASQLFGIKIDLVQEVLALQQPAKLPKLPHFVEGIINYQNKVIPLVDLRKRFGLKKIVNKELTRIMVVEVNDELVAMIADDIQRIIKMEEKHLKKPSKMFRGLDEKYIVGVTQLEEGSFIVLDLAEILSKEEKIELFGIKEFTKATPAKAKAKPKQRKGKVK